VSRVDGGRRSAHDRALRRRLLLPGHACRTCRHLQVFGRLAPGATDELAERLDGFLPALLRKHGIDLWVVPMREYNEDPVFLALVAPQTFAARRRTIHVFFDKGAAQGEAPAAACPAAATRR
jgi:hypothetical protein